MPWGAIRVGRVDVTLGALRSSASPKVGGAAQPGMREKIGPMNGVFALRAYQPFPCRIYPPAAGTGTASTLCNEAQAPTAEMAVTPPSIRKSAPTTYAESSDAR